MRGLGGVGAAALFAFGLAGLSACGGNPAAIAARDHNEPAAADDGYRTERAAYTAPDREAPARAARSERASNSEAAAPSVDGKPMWADNRTHSARENAQYQFDQHGTELKAASLNDFVAKAHRFVGEPPAGTLTMTRANGDTLMFDPKSGLFGVARSDGAPRTVFKPEDGMAYWRAQQASGGDTRASRSTSGSRRDDRG